jgi:hypothetical protein
MNQNPTTTEPIAIKDLLGRLVEVLEQEQAAIRKLDLQRLAEAVRGKEELALAFAASRTEVRAIAASTDPAMRELRTLAIHARALAHANRILIDEVSAVVGARVGVSTETTGYDARGARRAAARITPGRVL